MQPLQSSAPTRILLLIESANLPTPEHSHPRARVLRTDQLRPDQIRETVPERLLEHATDLPPTSSTRSVETHDLKTHDLEAHSREAHSREVEGRDTRITDFNGVAESAQEIDGAHKGSALPPPENVTSIACDDNIEILRDLLVQGAYELQILGSDLSPDALHHALHEENRPEVVILEASRDVSVVAARCYEIKREAHCAHSSLLVVLPLAFLDSPNASQTVSQLMKAGVDDFLACNAAHHEMTARIASLTALSRTRLKLAQTEEKLRDLLQTDELTNLLSRRFFFRTAHREYERARRYSHDLSCLMVDVNYFRRITETMGFACGDAVLCHVASVLRDMARDVDIVARFSDQKFVLLLPESDMAMAETIAERIVHEVAARPFQWQGETLPLTVSVGESTRRGADLASAQAPQISSPDDIEYSKSDTIHASSQMSNEELHDSSPSLHEAVASILEEADAALYVAKRGVRNTLMTTPMASPLLQSP